MFEFNDELMLLKSLLEMSQFAMTQMTKFPQQRRNARSY
ncbi:hypothetical protein AS4_00130 [Acinetobacter guillouiae]|nr:hypothetical protein AS4_00130 [Acinetobacter guillouiae]